ncbi:MAG: alpha/beta hydrolase, partial [Acidimicrobiia bacterium]|nr:alpha/beta hydrolase [Acidimicrobiia bacterium]
VMLLVMEADPGATRSAILQSVKPPNETPFAHESDSPLRAIELVFTSCEADEDCSVAYPNLADDFHELVRRLNDEPVDVEIEDSADGERIPIVFDGDHLIDWIAVDQLYRPVFAHHDAAYLPLLIDEVRRGNAEPLEIAAQRFWTANVENPNWTLGLMFAINCQQDLPAAGPERSTEDLSAGDQLDGFARWTSQRSICEAWDLAPLPPAAVDYVRSERPALVLAGSFDPVTPPIWSRTTAEHLSNSTYVEFPAHGHDVTTDNPCAATLEAAFIADPSAELDTSCVETTPGRAFILPGDVMAAPGLARSGDEVSLGAPGGVAWIEAIVFVGAYGSVLLIPILAVFGLVWLMRTRRRNPETVDRTALIAHTLALLSRLAAIAVVMLVDQVTDDYSSRSRLAFALGPSRDLLSVRLLAWTAPVAGMVILALAGITAWAWVGRKWSAGFRLLTTASALCTLTIVFLGGRWDLFTMLL